jgi:hypothetical protein
MAATAKKPNPKKAPAARRPRKAIEPPFTVPSLLTDEQRQAEEDRLVANMLAGLDAEEVRLQTLRKVNKAAGNDMVPPSRPGEPPMTYTEAFKQIETNRAQLLETCGQEQIERCIALAREGAGS